MVGRDVAQQFNLDFAFGLTANLDHKNRITFGAIRVNNVGQTVQAISIWPENHRTDGKCQSPQDETDGRRFRNDPGIRAKVKVAKNKVAPPFKEAEVDIIFGKGISKLGELIDLGVEFGFVDKAGAWFSYSDERIGQGRDNAQKFLEQNTDMKNKLEKEIKSKINL